MISDEKKKTFRCSNRKKTKPFLAIVTLSFLLITYIPTKIWLIEKWVPVLPDDTILFEPRIYFWSWFDSILSFWERFCRDRKFHMQRNSWHKTVSHFHINFTACKGSDSSLQLLKGWIVFSGIQPFTEIDKWCLLCKSYSDEKQWIKLHVQRMQLTVRIFLVSSTAI